MKESEIQVVAITCDTPIAPLTEASRTPKDDPIRTLEYPAARLSKCVIILPFGGDTAIGTDASYECNSTDVPTTCVTDTVITLPAVYPMLSLQASDESEIHMLTSHTVRPILLETVLSNEDRLDPMRVMGALEFQ